MNETRKLGINLRAMRDGRNTSVDLLDATTEEIESYIEMQVKHQITSNVTALTSALVSLVKNMSLEIDDLYAVALKEVEKPKGKTK